MTTALQASTVGLAEYKHEIGTCYYLNIGHHKTVVPCGDPRCVERGDPREGPYYVSVVSGNQTRLLLGPYERHGDALRNVERARNHANDIDPRAWFYGYGTVRVLNEKRVGIFNGELCLFPEGS